MNKYPKPRSRDPEEQARWEQGVFMTGFLAGSLYACATILICVWVFD